MISSIIRALLEDNSIIISKFGTFYVKHISAQIKNDIVYPPHTIVEFDFSKEVEDFSFVNKLSQWEQIRIDEAQDRIFEWVNLIEKGLTHNPSVFFDDFGTFSKDSNGKIVFQEMIIPQLNIENEGFKPVFIPVKNKKHQIDTIPIKDKRIILRKKEQKRDRILFFSILFASIAIISILFLKDHLKNLYQNVKKSTHIIHIPDEIENESVIFIGKVAEEKQMELDISDNTNEAIDSEQDIVINKIENKEHTLISLSNYKELYLPYQKGNYYLIAGSFMKEESALLHIKQKKLEKYNAKLIVHPDSPRIRICIGIFDNEKEAIDIATQIDKNYWVLK